MRNRRVYIQSIILFVLQLLFFCFTNACDGCLEWICEILGCDFQKKLTLYYTEGLQLNQDPKSNLKEQISKYVPVSSKEEFEKLLGKVLEKTKKRKEKNEKNQKKGGTYKEAGKGCGIEVIIIDTEEKLKLAIKKFGNVVVGENKNGSPKTENLNGRQECPFFIILKNVCEKREDLIGRYNDIIKATPEKKEDDENGKSKKTINETIKIERECPSSSLPIIKEECALLKNNIKELIELEKGEKLLCEKWIENNQNSNNFGKINLIARKKVSEILGRLEKLWEEILKNANELRNNNVKIYANNNINLSELYKQFLEYEKLEEGKEENIELAQINYVQLKTLMTKIKAFISFLCFAYTDETILKSIKSKVEAVNEDDKNSSDNTQGENQKDMWLRIKKFFNQKAQTEEKKEQVDSILDYFFYCPPKLSWCIEKFCSNKKDGNFSILGLVSSSWFPYINKLITIEEITKRKSVLFSFVKEVYGENEIENNITEIRKEFVSILFSNLNKGLEGLTEIIKTQKNDNAIMAGRHWDEEDFYFLIPSQEIIYALNIVLKSKNRTIDNNLLFDIILTLQEKLHNFDIEKCLKAINKFGENTSLKILGHLFNSTMILETFVDYVLFMRDSSKYLSKKSREEENKLRDNNVESCLENFVICDKNNVNIENKINKIYNKVFEIEDKYKDDGSEKTNADVIIIGECRTGKSLFVRNLFPSGKLPNIKVSAGNNSTTKGINSYLRCFGDDNGGKEEKNKKFKIRYIDTPGFENKGKSDLGYNAVKTFFEKAEVKDINKDRYGNRFYILRKDDNINKDSTLTFIKSPTVIDFVRFSEGDVDIFSYEHAEMLANFIERGSNVILALPFCAKKANGEKRKAMFKTYLFYNLAKNEEIKKLFKESIDDFTKENWGEGKTKDDCAIIKDFIEKKFIIVPINQKCNFPLEERFGLEEIGKKIIENVGEKNVGKNNGEAFIKSFFSDSLEEEINTSTKFNKNTINTDIKNDFIDGDQYEGEFLLGEIKKLLSNFNGFLIQTEFNEEDAIKTQEETIFEKMYKFFDCFQCIRKIFFNKDVLSPILYSYFDSEIYKFLDILDSEYLFLFFTSENEKGKFNIDIFEKEINFIHNNLETIEKIIKEDWKEFATFCFLSKKPDLISETFYEYIKKKCAKKVNNFGKRGKNINNINNDTSDINEETEEPEECGNGFNERYRINMYENNIINNESEKKLDGNEKENFAEFEHFEEIKEKINKLIKSKEEIKSEEEVISCTIEENENLTCNVLDFFITFDKEKKVFVLDIVNARFCGIKTTVSSEGNFVIKDTENNILGELIEKRIKYFNEQKKNDEIDNIKGYLNKKLKKEEEESTPENEANENFKNIVEGIKKAIKEWNEKDESKNEKQYGKISKKLKLLLGDEENLGKYISEKMYNDILGSKNILEITEDIFNEYINLKSEKKKEVVNCFVDEIIKKIKEEVEAEGAKGFFGGLFSFFN